MTFGHLFMPLGLTTAALWYSFASDPFRRSADGLMERGPGSPYLVRVLEKNAAQLTSWFSRRATDDEIDGCKRQLLECLGPSVTQDPRRFLLIAGRESLPSAWNAGFLVSEDAEHGQAIVVSADGHAWRSDLERTLSLIAVTPSQELLTVEIPKNRRPEVRINMRRISVSAVERVEEAKGYRLVFGGDRELFFSHQRQALSVDGIPVFPLVIGNGWGKRDPYQG